MNLTAMFAYMPTIMAATADTATDLFNEEWTTGNLYAIQPIVNVLGTLAVWVISAVGFFIVIFSILKNAISGLYVVNPSFWDRVDELKTEAVEGIGGTVTEALGNVPGKGNAVASKLGGALTWMLHLIPNVKALTDFNDDEVVDKKQYFMRSIPLLVAQIFIGMLIFMGYPAKIAKWIGSGATYAVDAVIKNVDPVETIQKISDKIYIANLTTDGSQDTYDKFINDATHSIMSSVLTVYNDMEKQPTQNTALYIESQLMQAFNKDAVANEISIDANYDVSVTTTRSNIVPSPSQNGYQNVGATSATADVGGLWKSTSAAGDVTYMTWFNGADINTGSTKASSDDYFVLTAHCTPKAAKNTSSIVAELYVTKGEMTNRGTTKEVALKGAKWGGSDVNSVKGVLGKQVTIDLDGTGTRTITGTLTSRSVQATSVEVVYLTMDNSVGDADISDKTVIYLPDGYTYTLRATGNSTTSVKIGSIKFGGNGNIKVNNTDVTDATSLRTATQKGNTQGEN